MTLSAALGSATSSLRAIQTRLAVASANIANADDVHYSAKTATQTSRGDGGGVDITGITGKVDANLLRSINQAAAEDGAAQTFLSYIQRLSDSLGTLSADGAGDTLASSLTALESSLDELATTPESATLKGQVVGDLDDVAAGLRDAAAQIQTLRADADGAIADAVGTVNDALHRIDSLNDAIVRAQAAGDSSADLEDQRAALVQTVAEQLDVTTFTDSTGRMHVHTGAGQVLVGSAVHELDFTASDSQDGAITVNGRDVTAALRSGSLAALVQLRDTTLPAFQDQLDALAVELRDTVNAIANQGAAAPPPNSLTGSAAVAATDALAASGTLRVAITDADGVVVSTEDIDLSTFSTVGDLVGALDGISGLSASLDSDGHLVLSADESTQGVAVAGGTINSANVSAFFGLNDLLVGDGAADLAVNSALAADSSRLPIGSMDTSATLAVGDTAISAGSGTLAQSLADALRDADLSADAATMVSDVGSLLSTAKSRASSSETGLATLVDSFSSQYGVNVDEETARISQLQNAYSASAQVLSAVQSMFDDLLNAVR